MKNFEKIFKELQVEFKRYNNGLIETKKQLTPDFNAFEILKPKELSLSGIVGEFLNPKGTHEHGRIFLDLFIDRFLNSKTKLKNSKQINLKLEYRFNNGQIDTLIDFDKEYGIAIENKPFASDQDKQIIRYTNYLSSVYGETNFTMIYLSSDGSEPSENSLPKIEKDKLGQQFIIISYSQFRKWFLDCAQITKQSKSERLSAMILEFAEFINKIFNKTNSLKDNMIGKTIENNILDAYELNLLWIKNKEDYENIWTKKINQLVNQELPRLIFKKLKNKNILNDDWEINEGKFDISKNSLTDVFGFKKKSWKHFSIGISSTAHRTPNGTQNFFPIIKSGIKISPATKKQTEKYNIATKCDPDNWIGGSCKVFWSANFGDKDFYNWNYTQWSEIKQEGKTVDYVAEFLGELIKVSEFDIDNIENNIQKRETYSENDFREFVNKFQWIFAKTYAQTAPHEYIVLNKIGNEYKDEFITIAQFIRDKGFKVMYYKREGYYYKLDENYYWTMDDDINDTNLINRAKLSDYELIDNSWLWKGRKK